MTQLCNARQGNLVTSRKPGTAVLATRPLDIRTALDGHTLEQSLCRAAFKHPRADLPSTPKRQTRIYMCPLHWTITNLLGQKG